MSSIPGDWQDEAYWKLRKENERLRACLKECSDELECYIVHHYDGTLNYPSRKQKFDGEMSVVIEARKLLADEQATSIDPKVPTDIDPEYFDREPS